MGTNEGNVQHRLIVEALTSATRAREMANAAHKRLDRMNGSIDTLANEVRETRTVLAQRIDKIDVEDAVEKGREQGREQLLTPARTFMLAIACSVVTATITHYLG